MQYILNGSGTFNVCWKIEKSCQIEYFNILSLYFKYLKQLVLRAAYSEEEYCYTLGELVMGDLNVTGTCLLVNREIMSN